MSGQIDVSTKSPCHWWLYLIECSNGAYYAGISNDVERRYAAHVAGRGAKYTRAFPPVRLLGVRIYENRSAASKAEFALRKLTRTQKLAFINPDAGAHGST